MYINIVIDLMIYHSYPVKDKQEGYINYKNFDKYYFLILHQMGTSLVVDIMQGIKKAVTVTSPSDQKCSIHTKITKGT